MVTFKRNYEVRILEENNYCSGVFVFLKDKSYESKYKKINECEYLHITDKDGKVELVFNKIDEEKYLYD